MQELLYVAPGGSKNNASDCVQLRFGEPYILSSIKGVSGLTKTVVSNQIVGVDGVGLQGIYTAPREIPCTVYVKGTDRADMYRQRLELISKLATRKTCGTLYYSNDYITVQIEAVPILPGDFSEKIKNYNKCDITFYCPYPYWSDCDMQSVQVDQADTSEGFSFPLAFQDLVSFSDNRKSLTINYNGSVPTPVWITLVGTLYAPTITNVTTGESITISDVDMGVNGSLVICTKRGSKSVMLVKDGVVSDAFNLVVPTSTFWELQPGQNVISYTSYKGISAATLVVSYYNLYEGV